MKIAEFVTIAEFANSIDFDEVAIPNANPCTKLDVKSGLKEFNPKQPTNSFTNGDYSVDGRRSFEAI